MRVPIGRTPQPSRAKPGMRGVPPTWPEAMADRHRAMGQQRGVHRRDQRGAQRVQPVHQALRGGGQHPPGPSKTKTTVPASSCAVTARSSSMPGILCASA